MPVRVVSHRAVVVADVTQRKGRFGRTGPVLPQAAGRVESVQRGKAPALRRNEVDGIQDVVEDRLGDEVVEIDPDPAGLDAFATQGCLALELTGRLDVE